MYKPVSIKQSCSEVYLDDHSIVSIYRSLRNYSFHSCLLEARDYVEDQNCYSYIGLCPISSFQIKYNDQQQAYQAIAEFPGNAVNIDTLPKVRSGQQYFEDYVSSFEIENTIPTELANGFFGYLSYEAVQCFEDLEFSASDSNQIPLINYHLFRYVIAYNHQFKKSYLIVNDPGHSAEDQITEDELIIILQKADLSQQDPFKSVGEETSNMSEAEHGEMIAKCKEHIQRGDIFQIVPSRSFTQKYQGDDFNVYRALRKINPSPFLFYFDFAAFRIFGSSPEAELIVKDNQASVHPIAGTTANSPDPKERKALIEALVNDPKENSEHVMLVDLARNDLSRNCLNVFVEKYREVQIFSHVIHLVSVVSGEIDPADNSVRKNVQLLADTFPAGTLSGAPKYRAMQLIDQYEADSRGFYGGAIGIIKFNSESVHAIMIRSFLSKDKELIRRAGGGVVINSDIDKEILEVKNKLGALAAAIELAEEI